MPRRGKHPLLNIINVICFVYVYGFSYRLNKFYLDDIITAITILFFKEVYNCIFLGFIILFISVRYSG